MLFANFMTLPTKNKWCPHTSQLRTQTLTAIKMTPPKTKSR